MATMMARGGRRWAAQAGLQLPRCCLHASTPALQHPPLARPRRLAGRHRPAQTWECRHAPRCGAATAAGGHQRAPGRQLPLLVGHAAPTRAMSTTAVLIHAISVFGHGVYTVTLIDTVVTVRLQRSGQPVRPGVRWLQLGRPGAVGDSGDRIGPTRDRS